jgi:hypothetical protein
VTEVGDRMRDRRWRLGRRHDGARGEVGAMAATLDRLYKVPTCAAAPDRHGIVVAQAWPPDAIAQLLPRTGMKGSALAGAELGDGGERAR